MAYVWKVRTASGAVAVQVAGKNRGQVVVVAHVGSAHTGADLGILLDQARPDRHQHLGARARQWLHFYLNATRNVLPTTDAEFNGTDYFRHT